MTKPQLQNRISQLEPGRRRKLHSTFKQATKQAKKPKIRTRVQFARECLVIPEGPYEDQLWKPHFQPFAYWLLHLMDTCGLHRFAITGCVQSGKTLITLVVNVCWHLFERRESVIFFVPELSMAEKKWRDEIEPVIRRSPYMRKFLPKGGPGSRG